MNHRIALIVAVMATLAGAGRASAQETAPHAGTVVVTVIPAAATREAKRSTSGCRPGISWITITAGPDPLRWVRERQRTNVPSGRRSSSLVTNGPGPSAETGAQPSGSST